MRFIERERKYIIPIILLQIIFLIILGITFQFDLPVAFYRNMLMISFIECACVSLLGDLLNIFQLFLISSLFFVVNRAFMECLLGFSANTVQLTKVIKIPDIYMTITYKVYCISLICTSIGWLLGSVIFQKKLPTYQRDTIVGKGIKIVFGISSLLYAYKLLITIRYYNKLGYNWRVTNLTFPWFLTGAGILFTIFGVCTLFFSHSRRAYLKTSYMIMLVYVLVLISGIRGEPIYVLMTIMLFWTSFHQKIRIKTAAIIGILSLLGIYIIGVMRREDNSLQFGIFLWQQSISFCVLPLFIMNKNKIRRSVPYAFGYLVDFFSSSNNSGSIENNHRLMWLLIHSVDYDAYKRGMNIGTSQGAEFYDLAGGNLIIIGILYIVVILLLMCILAHLYDNPITFYLGYIFTGIFIYSPRYSVFGIVRISYIVCFLGIFFIYLMHRLLRNIYVKAIKISM